MRRAWTLAIVAGMMVPIHPTNGQTPPSNVQRPFRGSVDVVTLNVTVVDGSHRYVADLQPTDFLVFEDGRKQELTFFQKTGLPLAVALLLDSSASMQDNMPIAQEAAIGFVRELASGDVASVIDFDSRVQVRQAFTTNRSVLEHAIRQTSADGSTSLYNAVYIALKELGKTIRDEPLAGLRRRAIVLLSDGEDTSSLVGFEQVLDLAARSDTAIYAIGLLERQTPATRRPQEGQFVLRRLTQQTGGRAFFPTDAELIGIYAEIKAELSSQYRWRTNRTTREGMVSSAALRSASNGQVRWLARDPVTTLPRNDTVPLDFSMSPRPRP